MDKEKVQQKILAKMLVFLAYRARTRKELEFRLARYLKSEKGLDAKTKVEVTDYVFKSLEKNKLINDAQFAQLLIQSKTKGKKALGRKAIQDKLVAKGIDKESAQKYVEESVSEDAELKTASNLLTKKYGEVPQLPWEEFRMMQDKMGRYLLSKGFSYSIAKRAVDYLLKRP